MLSKWAGGAIQCIGGNEVEPIGTVSKANIGLCGKSIETSLTIVKCLEPHLIIGIDLIKALNLILIPSSLEIMISNANPKEPNSAFKIRDLTICETEILNNGSLAIIKKNSRSQNRRLKKRCEKSLKWDQICSDSDTENPIEPKQPLISKIESKIEPTKRDPNADLLSEIFDKLPDPSNKEEHLFAIQKLISELKYLKSVAKPKDSKSKSSTNSSKDAKPEQKNRKEPGKCCNFLYEMPYFAEPNEPWPKREEVYSRVGRTFDKCSDVIIRFNE